MAKIDLAVLGLSPGPHVIVAKAGAAMYVDSQPSNIARYDDGSGSSGLTAGVSDDGMYIYVNRNNLSVAPDTLSIVDDNDTVLATMRLGNYIEDTSAGVWHTMDATTKWWGSNSYPVEFVYGSAPDALVNAGASVGGGRAHTSGSSIYTYYNSCGSQRIYSRDTNDYYSPGGPLSKIGICYAQFPNLQTTSYFNTLWGERLYPGLLRECGVINPAGALLCTQPFVDDHGVKYGSPYTTWQWDWTDDFWNGAPGRQIVAKVVGSDGSYSNKFAFYAPRRIVTSLENCTVSGSDAPLLFCPVGGTVSLQIDPAYGYAPPSFVNILNARYVYNRNTGVVQISATNNDPLIGRGDIYLSATTSTPGTYTASATCEHGTIVVYPNSYTTNDTIGFSVAPDTDYYYPRALVSNSSSYPTDIIYTQPTTHYETKSYSNLTGIGQFANVGWDLALQATCARKVYLASGTNHLIVQSEYGDFIPYYGDTSHSVDATCDEGYLMVGPFSASGGSILSHWAEASSGTYNRVLVRPNNTGTCTISCPMQPALSVTCTIPGAHIRGPAATCSGRSSKDAWYISVDDPVNTYIKSNMLTITNANLASSQPDDAGYASVDYIKLSNQTGNITIGGSVGVRQPSRLSFSNNLSWDFWGASGVVITTSNGNQVVIHDTDPESTFAGTVIDPSCLWFEAEFINPQDLCGIYGTYSDGGSFSWNGRVYLFGNTTVDYLWAD